MAASQKGQTNIPAPAAHSLSHGALNIVESAVYCGVHCSAIESVIRDGKLQGRRLGRNVIILKAKMRSSLRSTSSLPILRRPFLLAGRRGK